MHIKMLLRAKQFSDLLSHYTRISCLNFLEYYPETIIPIIQY